ncbi:hypothetical protein LEP1GSC193_2186 [Leptospira alstonii serovar Pingchang str. 80-412]|uniref:Uncharacterized protein n=2 Tax=Leptospira alstonii TaxID=28452 RepID=M6CVL5_9LEPT|nr:hypothetical protein LEP1GSC194_0411 [Leptospira alstonii serovar Sichuan str. 79601]EQA79755.1 hypothetical protein LEP1GSC193_2186 [Leptospira alstonii serovar Pingchang str. 80-412]
MIAPQLEKQRTKKIKTNVFRIFFIRNILLFLEIGFKPEI